MKLPDKFPTSESDWKYNGPFSSSAEIHMGTIGLALGFFVGLSKTIREEVSEEPQYLLGFALIGFAISYILGDNNE